MVKKEEELKEGDVREIHGLGWRVSLSIIVGVGWLVFLILWLFFYASAYHIYQNVAIVLASLLLVAIMLGAPWAWWGAKAMKEMTETRGFRWRVWLSLLVTFGLFVFLIIWFYTYASCYSIYQNIAIFIVSFLIMGGILGAAWAPWGMKYGRNCEKDK
jgi:MFS family permease